MSDLDILPDLPRLSGWPSEIGDLVSQDTSSSIDVIQELASSVAFVEEPTAGLEHDDDQQKDPKVELHHEGGSHIKHQSSIQEVDS